MPAPDPEKLEKLQAALEAYESGDAGGTLFDRAEEEALEPVRKRALGLLDQRARSRAELRGRLVKAEFEETLVDRVLDDLERSGLVDDETFAREWVRQRAARRGKSSMALDRELQQKGVAAGIRAAALEQISREDEESAARAAAEKKARSISSPPADRREYDSHLRRIVGVMARRGYDSALCLKLGREVLEERIAELETD